MNLAPIIVFAYDRPDHLEQTLVALAKNDLASQSVLYVYCDGAREYGGETSETTNSNYITKRYGKIVCLKEEFDTYLTRIAETRKVAHKIKGFKEVHVIERVKNIGLADNIVSAVTEIVNQYGRVIAFEDDIVCTHGTLTYLNEALELYNDDEQVMHISAYTYPHKIRLPQTFFYYSPYPAGGWATWQRAWKHYNPDVVDHVRYWNNDWNTFNILGQNHLQKQLLLNMTGALKTWYIRWYSSMRRMNGLCLYPGVSMSNNIGFDGTGETSQRSSNKYYVPNPSEYVEVKRIPIECNKKAFRFFLHRASGYWYSRRYRKEWWRKICAFLSFGRK